MYINLRRQISVNNNNKKKYNLLTILKLQHDILRPCYRPIIKVQNPNLRIFPTLSPCLPSPLHASLPE